MDLEDFSNNLATDLGPLLALFGESMTKQYLSECTTMPDYIIFAVAPIGIITAIVSVIRICGNSTLRAFVGRAQEGTAAAEVELCTSTGRDVCEVFTRGGIARVLGRPSILELVRLPTDKPDPNKPADETMGLQIYRHFLRSKRQEGFCVQRDNSLDPEDEQRKPGLEKQPLVDLEKPNLSLNVGIVKPPQCLFWLVAIVGSVLQLGVLAFAVVAAKQFPKEEENEENDKGDSGKVSSGESSLYAPIMFVVGMAMQSAGMGACAALIGHTTQEYHVKRKGLPDKLIWLQPGNQTIGDQSFSSFAYLETTLTHVKRYTASTMDDEKRRRYYIHTTVAATATFLGYIAYFIGLRGLSPWVSIAQLALTVLMSLIRGSLRIQRRDMMYNKLANLEDKVHGHELDWLALRLGAEGFIVDSETPGGYIKTALKELSTRLAPRLPSMSLLDSSNLDPHLKDVAVQLGLPENNLLHRLGLDKESSLESFASRIYRLVLEMSTDPPPFKLVQVIGRVLPANTTPTPEIALRPTAPEPAIAPSERELRDRLCHDLRKHSNGPDPLTVFRLRARLAYLTGNAPFQMASSPRDYQVWKDNLVAVRRKSYALGRAACAAAAALLDGKVESLPTSFKLEIGVSENTAVPTLRQVFPVELRKPSDAKPTEWTIDTAALESLLGLWLYSIAGPMSKGSESEPSPSARVVSYSDELTSWGRQTYMHGELTLWVGSGAPKPKRGLLAVGPEMRLRFCRPYANLGWKPTKRNMDDTGPENEGRRGDPVRFFGWQCLPEIPEEPAHVPTEFYYVKTQATLLDICAQQLYTEMVRSITSRGESHVPKAVLKDDENGRRLDNEVVKIMKATFLECELGSATAAMLCIAPGLGEKLGFDDTDIQDKVQQMMLNCKENGRWAETEPVVRWACACFSDPNIRYDVAMFYGHALTDHENKHDFAIEGFRWLAQLDRGLKPFENASILFLESEDARIAIEQSITATASRLHDSIRDGEKTWTLCHLWMYRRLHRWGLGAEQNPHAVVEAASLHTLGRALSRAAAKLNPRDSLSSDRHFWAKLCHELVGIGAPATIKVEGRSAMSLAVEYENSALVKIILHHNTTAAPETQEDCEHLPLFCAARLKSPHMAELLLPNASGGPQDKLAAARTRLLFWAVERRWHSDERRSRASKRHSRKELYTPEGRKAEKKRKDEERSARERAIKDVDMILNDTDIPVNLGAVDFDDRNPLAIAADTGHLEAVKLLLRRVRTRTGDMRKITGAPESYVDGDSRDWNGCTPIFLAASGGHEVIVEELLECSFNLNSRSQEGQTPLIAAVLNNRVRAVKKLIGNPYINPNTNTWSGATPLLLAARNGFMEVVKCLIQHEDIYPSLKLVDSYGMTPLSAAAKNGMVKTVKALLRELEDISINAINNEGRTALSLAAGEGHWRVVKFLLAADGVEPDQPDSRNDTPLMIAAMNGHIDVVKVLIKDPRVNLGRKGFNNSNPLIYAAQNGHREVVKFLLLHGSRDWPNSKTSRGYTALCLAAIKGKTGAVIELLQDSRVIRDEPDNRGRTPLSWAASGRHLNIVMILVIFGRVDPNLADDGGRTPFSYAVESGYMPTIHLMLQRRTTLRRVITRRANLPVGSIGHEEEQRKSKQAILEEDGDASQSHGEKQRLHTSVAAPEVSGIDSTRADEIAVADTSIYPNHPTTTDVEAELQTVGEQDREPEVEGEENMALQSQQHEPAVEHVGPKAPRVVYHPIDGSQYRRLFAVAETYPGYPRPNPNTADKKGRIPLWYCLRYMKGFSRKGAVKILLRHGALQAMENGPAGYALSFGQRQIDRDMILEYVNSLSWATEDQKRELRQAAVDPEINNEELRGTKGVEVGVQAADQKLLNKGDVEVKSKASDKTNDSDDNVKTEEKLSDGAEAKDSRG